MWVALSTVIVLAGPGVLGTAAAPAATAPAVVGPEVVASLQQAGRARVLVTFRDDGFAGSDMAAAATVARSRAAVLSAVAPVDFRVIWTYELVPAVAGEVSAAGLAELVAHPLVRSVQPDREERPTMGEAVPAVGGDRVRSSYGLTGKGVNVAVLDTGIDKQHPDLADSLIAEKCYSDTRGCAPNNATESDNAQDEAGHGTGVSGIITGNGTVAPAGIAPDAGIAAVRVFNDGSSASTSDIVKGLDWVLQKARLLDIKLVNMSLGSTAEFQGNCDSEDAARAEAVKRLGARGVTVFVAAGNGGSLNGVSAPACLSGVIAVGATYDSDVGRYPPRGEFGIGCFDATTSATTIACFSNSGSAVDLLAPGVPITHPRLGGGSATSAGTSDASPLAAGVAALLLQAKDGLRPAQLESVLHDTGTPVKHPKNNRTFRLVNAFAAVEDIVQATVTPRAVASPTATFRPPTATVTPQPTTLSPTATPAAATATATPAAATATATTTATATEATDAHRPLYLPVARR